MPSYTVYVPRADDSVPERDFRRGLDPLLDHPDVEVTYCPGRDYDAIEPDEVPGANAIIAIQERVTADLVAALPTLEIVAAFGAGLDHIDVPACTEHGVTVVNAPQPVRDAVAQSTLGMLLSCASNLHGFDARIRRDGFDGRYENMGVTLYEKTVGIVGMGLIGTRLLDLLDPFDVDVLVHDPYLEERNADRLGVDRVSLDALLARADFVSLHCPLTDETRGMLGPDEFERMQDTAYLVNAARGGLYADADLTAALRAGEIAGAAIDVFEDEPDVDDNPLLAVEDCLLTPHTSGLLIETTTEQGNLVSESILQRSRGEPPNNIVNPEAYDGPVAGSLHSPTYRS
ncbi:NAD(P)-dependent oxidoreductase [Halorubellus litoreus]|uniref:NAD(P)-dependent oxidoreductase n=1 Tax=Halorubellus litoreus TaxID=755308 RepID=A0ABD5VI68_9EURY